MPSGRVEALGEDRSSPELKDITSWVAELSQSAWFIDATDRAMEMGNPIFGNIMMIGAAAGIGLLPLDRKDFKSVISGMVAPDKVALNLSAYDLGLQMIDSANG